MRLRVRVAPLLRQRRPHLIAALQLCLQGRDDVALVDDTEPGQQQQGKEDEQATERTEECAIPAEEHALEEKQQQHEGKEEVPQHRSLKPQPDEGQELQHEQHLVLLSDSLSTEELHEPNLRAVVLANDNISGETMRLLQKHGCGLAVYLLPQPFEYLAVSATLHVKDLLRYTGCSAAAAAAHALQYGVFERDTGEQQVHPCGIRTTGAIIGEQVAST